MLDRLAEIKVPLMERYEQWLPVENRPVQFLSAPESVSHLRSPNKIAGLAKRRANIRDAILWEKSRHERHKQVAAPVSPVSSIESSPSPVSSIDSPPSSDQSDVSNVPFTEVGEISLSKVFIAYPLDLFRKLLK